MDIFGFPGYAVPERMTKKAPPSTLADAYTLAILTFRLLVLGIHSKGRAAEALDGDAAREAGTNGGAWPTSPTLSTPRTGFLKRVGFVELFNVGLSGQCINSWWNRSAKAG